MGKTIEERLQEILDDKDAEIERLEGELAEMTDRAEANHRWTTHERSEDDDPRLPIPRLEMRFRKISEDGYETEMVTFLVYRHLCDPVVRVPINRTRTDGDPSRRFKDGKFDLPYRDGSHIMHDAAHLGLPAFATDDEGHVEYLSYLSHQREGYEYQIKTGFEHRYSPPDGAGR